MNCFIRPRHAVNVVRAWLIQKTASVFKIASDWWCSKVLKGQTGGLDDGLPATEKHEVFPFAFYKVKSENQPSANGATTRPPKDAPK